MNNQIKNKVDSLTDGQLISIAMKYFREMLDTDSRAFRFVNKDVWEAIANGEADPDDLSETVTYLQDRLTIIIERGGYTWISSAPD